MLRETAAHFLFRIVGIIPDAIAYFTGLERAPAYFFGMISVAHIVLLWWFARRVRATEFQAAAAATLLAASATFFYYSRHMLPYDLAMLFALLALNAAVGREVRLINSLAAGACAALAFFSYPGYWTMVVAIVVIHLAHQATSWATVARRTLGFAAGALAAALPVDALFRSLTGTELLAAMTGYSSTITQGTFAEGGRLPFGYLWSAEHGLLLLWIVAAAAAAWRARRDPAEAPLIIRHGLLGAGLIYVAFAFFSTAIEEFVVYGRLARQLVPFLCLVAAFEIDRWRTKHPVTRSAAAAAIALFAAQVAFNFWQPFRVTFPQQFINDHRQRVAALEPTQYTWINADHIYPAPERVALPAQYTVLAEARHPLQFGPYLYEGFTPVERRLMRSTDLTMRLIRFD